MWRLLFYKQFGNLEISCFFRTTLLSIFRATLLMIKNHPLKYFSEIRQCAKFVSNILQTDIKYSDSYFVSFVANASVCFKWFTRQKSSKRDVYLKTKAHLAYVFEDAYTSSCWSQAFSSFSRNWVLVLLFCTKRRYFRDLNMMQFCAV